MQKRREKPNKKQTSRIADNPRKSELKKSSPAACLEILEALKERRYPRSERHPGRSGGLDVELLQKVALKKR